jgi:DNA-binding NtrC family response regulator
MAERVETIETLSRDEDRRREATVEIVPQLYILLECDRPAAASSRHLLRGIESVDVGRAAVRGAGRTGDALELGVPDARMSQPHARIGRRDGKWILEDAGSKNGVIVDGERRTRAVLTDGAMFELGHTLFLFREAPVEDAYSDDCDAADLSRAAPQLRTFVPALARVYADLAEVVKTPAPVLIHGETGTGKELLARAAHAMTRRPGSFVAVNCGALPENLVESELYGHKRGAFSGAEQDRTGLVRSADRGTLFLDEIADLPLQSQAALLRVLQEREVTPVGATQPISVDVRVVAASHHELAERVERDLFRRDLYARLAAYTAVLPPLRDRREDLGLLIGSMLADKPEVRISCAAARMLFEYDWPLNVRELESCLVVATALARGGAIRLEHLPETVRGVETIGAPLTTEDQARRDELVALLRTHAGNVSAVARATGKARAQIHRWLRRFQLDPASYRG